MKPEDVDQMFDADVLQGAAGEAEGSQEELQLSDDDQTTPTATDSTKEGAQEAGAAEDGQQSDDTETGEAEASPGKSEEPQTVPLAKYLEERATNSQLSERLDRVMSALEKDAEARVAAATAQEQKDTGPDPRFVNAIDKDEDLVGWMQRELEIKDAKIADVEKRQAQSEQVSREAGAQGVLMADLSAQEAAFEADHADYKHAVDYLRGQEAAKLGAHLSRMIRLGKVPAMNDAQRTAAIHQQITRNELALARQYHEAGDNPIEAIYDLAVASGYTPPAAGEGDKSNGKSEMSEAEKKIIEKSQQAKEAQSLGGGGPALTREVIERGSGDEFEAALRGRGFNR